MASRFLTLAELHARPQGEQCRRVAEENLDLAGLDDAAITTAIDNHLQSTIEDAESQALTYLAARRVASDLPADPVATGRELKRLVAVLAWVNLHVGFDVWSEGLDGRETRAIEALRALAAGTLRLTTDASTAAAPKLGFGVASGSTETGPLSLGRRGEIW